MRTYRAQLTQAYKVVLVLVFPPLILVPLVIVGMAEYAPEWVVIAAIVLMMALMIGLVLYLIKGITPKVEYTINGNTHDVKVLSKNLFATSSFSFKTADIRNFWADENENGVYFTISKTGYPASFSVNAASKTNEDVLAFEELLAAIDKAVAKQNTGETAPVIENKTMYETWWAKALLAFGVLVFIGAIAVGIVYPDKDIPWWRMGVLLAFLLPWAWKVYLHNKKERA